RRGKFSGGPSADANGASTVAEQKRRIARPFDFIGAAPCLTLPAQRGRECRYVSPSARLEHRRRELDVRLCPRCAEVLIDRLRFFGLALRAQRLREAEQRPAILG